MTEKILLVDDDKNILDGYKRSLRKDYNLEVALGAKEGLRMLGENGPYAVIVSDLRMPEIDGIQFLSEVRETVPDTVRMMLTGNADLDSSIQAVNEGNIFRFLTKPCPPETLTMALNAGVKQYRLVMAEKELLEKTLSGSVKVLIDILSMASPAAFGRATRVRNIMAQFAEKLDVENPWEFELAGMLSQTGCVTLPTEVIEKIYRRKPLNAVEIRMFESHPKLGYDLIANIPRLETIAEIILYQEKKFNGDGIPQDDVKGEDIPLGARALRLALDYDSLVWSGKNSLDAHDDIKKRLDQYDPGLVSVLEQIIGEQAKLVLQTFKINDLVSNMVLAQDVRTKSGLLLVAKGQSVTPALMERLRNFAQTGEVDEKVEVLIPAQGNTGYIA